MLMEKEFEYQMKLAGMQTENLSKRESAKEDRKDSRLDKQSTQQSKLIDQRKNNLPPKTFESNEDSMDGFDLSEFDPR